MSDTLTLTRANDSLFTAHLAGTEVGRCAVATSPHTWELYSTVTTPGYEGRGIAATLVEHVLAQADAAGVSVIPSCWYVDGLMQRRSPRWDHLRVGHSAVDSAAAAPAAQPGDACRIAPAVLGTTPAPGATTA